MKKRHDEAVITVDKLTRHVIFKIVRGALQDTDPEGLIKMGSPRDEYDPEAREITDVIMTVKGAITPRDIHIVWMRWFGSGTDGRGHVHTAAVSDRPSFYEAAKTINERLNGI